MLVWEVRARSSVVRKIAMLGGWLDKAFAPLWRWSVLAKGHDNSVQLNWKQENISVWNGLTWLAQWANGKNLFVIFPFRMLPIAQSKIGFLFPPLRLLSVEWCICTHYTVFYVCLNALGRTLTHQLSHRQLSPEAKSILFFSSMQMCDVHDTFSLILIPRSLAAAAANTSVNRNCEIRRDCCTRQCPHALFNDCLWSL